MAAHADAGSRGEALRAYERCRRVLAKELGVQPAAETETAYLDLLGDEPGPRSEAPLPVPRLALPSPPRGLSSQLVDREAEAKALGEAWARPRAAALAAELRQPYYLRRTRAWQATVAVIDGRPVDAEHAAGQALAVWRSEVHPDAQAWSAVHLGVLRILQGRAGQVGEAVRELADAYPMVPSYRCLAAPCGAVEGRREQAWAAFSRFAHDGFTSPPVDSQWLFGVVALAETCAVLNETTPAEALYELLARFADRLVVLDAFGGGGGGFAGPVAHLGLLAAALGRNGQATTYFDGAAEAASRFGAPPWAVRSEAARERLSVPGRREQ